MRTLLLVVTFCSIGIAFPGNAEARNRGARPHRPQNNRLQRQAKRTVQGAKSGALTKEEAKAVAGQNQEIRQQKKAMIQENGGKLNPEQRKQIHQQLKAQNKEIYQEKHDGDTRAPASIPPTTNTQVPQ